MLSGVPGAAVCFDAAVARILVEGGLSVLLCGTDGDSLGRVAGGLCETPGRIGVMVGDPADADDLAAAVGMATELFGSKPDIVGSVGQARQVVARPGTEPPG